MFVARQAKKGYKIKNVYDGSETVQEVASLLNNFNVMVLLKDYPDNFRVLNSVINIDNSIGMPTSTNNNWNKYKTYQFVISDKTDYQIQVKLQGVKDPNQFGFILYQLGEKEDYFKTLN